MKEAVDSGAFFFALSPERNQIRYADGAVLLPGCAGVRMGSETLHALGVECNCECLMWDEAARRVTAIGLRSIQHGENQLSFAIPVDLEYSTASGQGVVFAQGAERPLATKGFDVTAWTRVTEDAWKTDCRYQAQVKMAWDKFGKVENQA